MKLYLDTSDREKIIIGLNKKRFETKAKEKTSQMLLSFIDKLLKKEGISVNQIKEIEVNLGPGSFTGLRVGIAVAQTFGWVLGIPVNGKNMGKREVLDIVYE